MVFDKDIDLGNLSANPKFEEIFNGLFDGDKVSQYIVYVVANFAKEWFKSNIERLDKSNTYMRLNYSEGVPESVLDRAKKLYAAVFEDQLKSLEEAKELWKKEHPDYYRMQPCLVSSKPLVDAFSESDGLKMLSESLTLDAAIQGYKVAGETLKSIPNSDLDQWCTDVKPMLNYEHKEEYDAMVAEMRQRLLIPDESEWIESLPLPKSQVPKTRLSLDRSKSVSKSEWSELVKLCVKSISLEQ